MLQRKLYFRPRPKPLAILPLNVRSIGHYRVGMEWREDSEPKWFHEIFWTVRGCGVFEVEGESFDCNPGDIFIYRPGEPHRIASRSDPWEYRWLTFDGPETERCLAGFGLFRIASRGRCPISLFEKLQAVIAHPARESEQKASVLAYSILVEAGHAAEPSERVSNVFQKCRALIEANYSNANLSIEEIAEEAGMHRASLYRMFMSEAGMTPVHYLQSIRLQAGLSRLAETDRPIAEIAHECGYRDANYFARVVRQATGMTPRKLRSHSRQ